MKTSSTVFNPSPSVTARKVKDVLDHTLTQLDQIDITVLGYEESVKLEELYNDIQIRMQSLKTE